ncbi:MAG: flagella basal body P-ring formation protein FlgA [Chelatococcus sp.]|nr:MAG: flagella basal body P-ring formation protein FlgA [Chelatococcus sp.]
MIRCPAARRPGLAGLVWLAAIAAPPALAQEVMLPVPVITLYPGDVVTDSHVVERAFRAGTRASQFSIESRMAIIGKVARRTLLPGQPIPVNAVDDPKLVRRGVPTQIVFRDADLVITGVVEPLQSAAVNETVKARNPDSGLVVVGVVQADGTIRVGGE